MTYQIPALHESLGGVSFPLNPDAFTDSLASLDPSRDLLLSLFQTAINAEIGTAWRRVVDSGLPAGSRFAGTDPVNDVLPMRPSLATMQARKCSFPLLALHRDGDVEIEEHLMDSIRVKQTWQLHYILGPGDLEIERKLLDVTTAIRSLLALVIRQRGHASFDGGELQFFPGKGTLSSVRLVKQSQVGKAVFSEDDSAVYWATVFTLETAEVDGLDSEALIDFEAIDTNLALSDSENTLPDFAQASSDVVTL